ncbi:hypothetical protein [Sporosarcina thermotolerans]|uniref:hypothetical protein n=1 Tax=Sporosarcina thermotolerans TaxID=633404 RepID=UPI0036D3741E
MTTHPFLQTAYSNDSSFSWIFEYDRLVYRNERQKKVVYTFIRIESKKQTVSPSP